MPRRSKKEIYVIAIERFYKLIESKKDRAVITRDEIIKFINKGLLPRKRFCTTDLRGITTRQLWYHVFKRFTGEETHYIFVKRRKQDVAAQIRNYRNVSSLY